MYVAWLYETLGFQGVQVAGRAGGVRKYNRVDIKDILGKRSEEEKKEKKKKKHQTRERETHHTANGVRSDAMAATPEIPGMYSVPEEFWIPRKDTACSPDAVIGCRRYWKRSVGSPIVSHSSSRSQGSTQMMTPAGP